MMRFTDSLVLHAININHQLDFKTRFKNSNKMAVKENFKKAKLYHVKVDRIKDESSRTLRARKYGGMSSNSLGRLVKIKIK